MEFVWYIRHFEISARVRDVDALWEDPFYFSPQYIWQSLFVEMAELLVASLADSLRVLPHELVGEERVTNP